jgi:hypothetical protein
VGTRRRIREGAFGTKALPLLQEEVQRQQQRGLWPDEAAQELDVIAETTRPVRSLQFIMLERAAGRTCECSRGLSSDDRTNQMTNRTQVSPDRPISCV